jgi:nickel/cobalt transporter (NicO) family protein
MHIPPQIVASFIAAVSAGLLHGLTPHGHSWLVLLPIALGPGVTRQRMARFAVAYSLGMLATAVVIGAALGAVSQFIPESWHEWMVFGVAGLLIILGLTALIRPLNVHHAIDHLCYEHCDADHTPPKLRSGSLWVVFSLGVMSMLVPCPSVAGIYAAFALTQTWYWGATVFGVYALCTGLTITIVAITIVSAKTVLQSLAKKNNRLLIWRLNGIIFVLVGAYMVVTAFQEHANEASHSSAVPPAVVAIAGVSTSGNY